MSEQVCYFHFDKSLPAYAIVANKLGDKMPVCLSCLAVCVDKGYTVEELLPPFLALEAKLEDTKAVP